MTRAGFLGRFQPPHRGHHQVITNYIEEYDEFVVIIGSADKSRSEDNPLSFEERKEIIENCFPGIEVVGVEDTEVNEDGNEKWSSDLLEQSDVDLVITQNDLVKQILRNHTELDIVEQEMYDEEIYSGTEVRRRVKSGEEWRYLVPDCAKPMIEQHLETIKESGIEYEFEPGWERKNAYHGTDS